MEEDSFEYGQKCLKLAIEMQKQAIEDVGFTPTEYYTFLLTCAANMLMPMPDETPQAMAAIQAQTYYDLILQMQKKRAEHSANVWSVDDIVAKANKLDEEVDSLFKKYANKS